jgi:DNA-damage-inducible protein J
MASGSSARKTGSGSQTVRARIDPTLKAKAEAVLRGLGLNTIEAIRLFYEQVASTSRLPFEARIPNAETRAAIRDARAGKGLKHYASAAEMFDELSL